MRLKRPLKYLWRWFGITTSESARQRHWSDESPLIFHTTVVLQYKLVLRERPEGNHLTPFPLLQFKLPSRGELSEIQLAFPQNS